MHRRRYMVYRALVEVSWDYLRAGLEVKYKVAGHECNIINV